MKPTGFCLFVCFPFNLLPLQIFPFTRKEKRRKEKKRKGKKRKEKKRKKKKRKRKKSKKKKKGIEKERGYLIMLSHTLASAVPDPTKPSVDHQFSPSWSTKPVSKAH